MFSVEFRCGGPNITHDFQALELIEHILIPFVPYDPAFSGPYSELLPLAADRDEVCEVRAKINKDAVATWYRDYKTKGERAYIASHYGEARANMVSSGNQALAETFRALVGNFGM